MDAIFHEELIINFRSKCRTNVTNKQNNNNLAVIGNRTGNHIGVICKSGRLKHSQFGGVVGVRRRESYSLHKSLLGTPTL